MDVRNCKSCGKLFNYMGGKPICEDCKRALENKFQEVKEYVRNNPNASIGQVAEDMEVSVKQIKEWVKQERLILSEATVDGILCEHCGRPIRSGRYCEKCKAAMANSFQSVLKKPVPEQKMDNRDERDKMRFLH